MNTKTIKVEMSEAEAADFVRWRRFEGMFREMEAAGVFDVRGGKAILNFTADGDLLHIKVYRNYYLRPVENRVMIKVETLTVSE